MTIIDGLQFTQLTNLNIEGELYEHGAPFGGVTAPLILSTANEPGDQPLILRGGAQDGDENYDSTNSGLLYQDGVQEEIWRIWASNPNIGGGANPDPNSANLYIGFQAGASQPTATENAGSGYANTGIGWNALTNNIGGHRNTAVGFRAMEDNNNANNNVAMGHGALQSLSSGGSNVAIGMMALNAVVAAGNNVAVGMDALTSSTGAGNTALGWEAMNSMLTGELNVAIGALSFKSAIEGDRNVAIGYRAMEDATSPDRNVFVGYEAGELCTNPAQNTGIGVQALHGDNSINNTGVGYQAGEFLGGFGIDEDNWQNTFLGSQAGVRIQTGKQNVMIGYQAGQLIEGETASDSNVLVGWRAGITATTGSNVVILGANLTAPTATTSDWMNLGGILEANLASGSEHIIIKNIPTGTGGLPTGGVWDDNGTLKIISA